MTKSCVFLATILVAFLAAVTLAQIHYVPAQILIPTINGTHIIASNGSIFNNSGVHYGPPNNTYNNNPNNNYIPPGSYYYNNSNSSYNRTWNQTGHYNETHDGHLFRGNIQTFDRLLFNQEYFKTSRWWGNREKIIEYPKDTPAGYSRHETISAIRIYNKFYDGNSARAYILKGGVGSQYVKIKLESKWNHGFRYLVQIFGH